MHECEHGAEDQEISDVRRHLEEQLALHTQVIDYYWPLFLPGQGSFLAFPAVIGLVSCSHRSLFLHTAVSVQGLFCLCATLFRCGIRFRV